MKVLVVGGGGREHALAWKLSQSDKVSEIIAVPGNAGIASLGRCIDLDINTEGHEALLRLAREEGVGLTVVGPEAPLVSGLVDLFEARGLRIFGPRQVAARLEGSKRFAKDFMQRHNLPTAHFQSFDDTLLALEYLDKVGAPIVVKDSNLAAGKGVTVARSKAEAVQAVRNILEAPEGGQIVIEEYLEGQELSLLALTDGKTIKPMLLAQDYKQVGDGDTGPMTGGMGALAPAPLLDAEGFTRLEQELLLPTLRGLQEDGLAYRGVLYFGLMLTQDGPKLLEYNCRFGDPETQAILPLLKTDFVDVLDTVIDGRLAELELHWEEGACACVVMAAPGYPGGYKKGIPLGVPDDLGSNVTVFHAGSALKGRELVSASGRVLGVTAKGATLEEALEGAYAAAHAIHFPGAHYRRDIGYRLLASR